MDILCLRCGEPWEIDYLHDVAAEQNTTFDAVYGKFKTDGCDAIGKNLHNEDTLKAHNNPVLSELYAILGDDVDGAASMIEDMPGMFRGW